MANKKIFSTSVYLNNTDSIKLFGTKSPWHGNMIPIEIGLNGVAGYGVAILNYASKQIQPTNKDDASVLTNYQFIKNVPRPVKINLVYGLNDEEAQNSLVTGGKGASLALLRSIEYKVPNGFVITVAALELQLNRQPHLVQLIKNIQNSAFAIGNESLEDACKVISAAFQQCKLEEEIVEATTNFYKKFEVNDSDKESLKFAVRSSAVGEDGDDASSAGQNESYLGVNSLSNVLEAIKKCWASLYTVQSVEYRRHHLLPINSQMAVVVQLMVPADCAGVLFTIHPTNGNPSKMLITANYGLGEVN